MVFKREEELERFLLQKCKEAITQTEQKVFDVIDKCLRRFYAEFEPEFYIRTQQLLHSLVRSRVVSDGKGFKAEVYFDVGLLNYEKGSVLLKKTMTIPILTKNGDIRYIQTNYGYANWDENTVLNVAMTSGLPHGGYASGTAVWEDAMRALASLGGVFEMLLKELKAQGIPIK